MLWRWQSPQHPSETTQLRRATVRMMDFYRSDINIRFQILDPCVV